MKVIPDTPIWSQVLRREKPNLSISNTMTHLIKNELVFLAGIIKQELLSGIRIEKQFNTLASHLQPFPELLASTEDHFIAAEFYNKCQRSGIQGSHVDFLILALAKHHSAKILTTDKDFQKYRTVIDFELELV